MLMNVNTACFPASALVGTGIGHLMTHQASKSWTPDKNRMSRIMLARLAEAHGTMERTDLDAIERARYFTLCKNSLEQGCLLVTFDS